ncbi:MAG TPA: hypothetical protein V6C65_15545 [Allocoleopsis sp.]
MGIVVSLSSRGCRPPVEYPVLTVSCQVGQRAYYATRALRLNGFNAHDPSGGFKTYQAAASA